MPETLEFLIRRRSGHATALRRRMVHRRSREVRVDTDYLDGPNGTRLNTYGGQ